MAKLAAAIPQDSTMDTVELQRKLIFRFSSIFPNQMFAISWHVVSAASNPTKLSLWRAVLKENNCTCKVSEKTKTAFLRTIDFQPKFFSREAAEKGSQDLANIRLGKQLESGQIICDDICLVF